FQPRDPLLPEHPVERGVLQREIAIVARPVLSLLLSLRRGNWRSVYPVLDGHELPLVIIPLTARSPNRARARRVAGSVRTPSPTGLVIYSGLASRSPPIPFCGTAVCSSTTRSGWNPRAPLLGVLLAPPSAEQSQPTTGLDDG